MTTDFLFFLLFLCLFGMMGVLMFILFPFRWGPTPSEWAPYLFIRLFGLLFFIPALLLLKRTIVAVGAASDERKGKLRQGIFVSSEGILVRLQPNECYPIALSEFVDALIRTSTTDDGDRDYYRIETTRGEIEFFAERMVGHPTRLKDRVEEIRKPIKRTR